MAFRYRVSVTYIKGDTVLGDRSKEYEFITQEVDDFSTEMPKPNENLFKLEHLKTLLANPNSDTSDGEEIPENIINLPTEIIEHIFKFLSFHQVAHLRQVCIRFRDLGNDLLNLHFLKMVSIIEEVLTKTIQEVAMPDIEQNMQYKEKGMDLQPGNQTTWKELVLKKHLFLVKSEWILRRLQYYVFFLHATVYRYIKSNSPFINKISFYGGKILDKIYAVLNIIKEKNMDYDITMALEDIDLLIETWVDYFHNNIEYRLVNLTKKVFLPVNYYWPNALYGIKIIDILECCMDCKKTIKVLLDYDGWFYFHGTYIISDSFFTCLSSSPYITYKDAVTLSIQEQRSLYEVFQRLGNHKNEYSSTEERLSHESSLKSDGNGDRFSAIYMGLHHCQETSYFYGHFSKQGYVNTFGDKEERKQATVTVTTELRCRGEFAPVPFLADRLESRCPNSVPQVQSEFKKISYAMENSPDIFLKVKISCPFAGDITHRLPTEYSCVISQHIFNKESVNKN